MRHKILFVEDEPDYFEPFIDQLEQQYALYMAHDLTQAVELMNQHRFSLFLIDIMLPVGMRRFPEKIDTRRTGVYFIRLIRGEVSVSGLQTNCPKDVPIIALTAVSDLSAKDMLGELNVVRFTKPFSMKAVMEEIKSNLDRRA